MFWEIKLSLFLDGPKISWVNQQKSGLMESEGFMKSKKWLQICISFLFAFLFVTTNLYAAKISELPEDTDVSGLDWTVVVDPAYSATSKITLENLLDGAQKSKFVYYTNGNISAAVAAIGSTECTLIIDADQTLGGSVTVPANIHLKSHKGAVITIPTGITLTIQGTFEAGDYQCFIVSGGTLAFSTQRRVSAAWTTTSGQPDGSTDNSADVQAVVNSLPTTTNHEAGTVYIPDRSARWKFNITVPKNVRIEGEAPHATQIAPYTITSPVIAVTGGRVHIRYLYFYGGSNVTNLYGIRHDRALDGKGGGLLVEHCRFYHLNRAIDINNNYYNTIQYNSFSNVVYGIYGRNAFNRNIIRENKFSAYEYGVAILYDSAVDSYMPHGNTTQDNAFESPSTGGIGIYYGNSGGNVSIHDYFEGHVAASGYPIMEAGGPVYGWHTGAGNEAFLVDSWGRDFTKLGVTVGTTVYNRRDGSSATVETITNGSATNDKLTMTLAGGSENDWDVDDYFVIDINSNEYITLDVAPATDWAAGDVITGQISSKTSTVVQKISSLVYQIRNRSGAYTLGEIIGVTGTPAKLADQGEDYPTTNKISTSRLGNKFMSPEFSSISESDKFVQGMNQISSGLIGTWGGYKTGDNVIATSTTDFSYTAGTWKTLTLSETNYFRYPTSMVRISYKFVNEAASAAVLTFRPKNGGAADAFHQIDVGASATVSGTLDIPLLDNESFSVVADQNGTLSIRIHKYLN